MILAAAVWYFYPHAVAPLTNYPSQGTDVVAFGDSLVAGYGASDGQDFVSDLSKTLGVPIINLGVSGNTTAQGLARVGDLDKYKPKVILLLLGGNDYIQRVPIEKTFDNLSNILEDFQKRGAVVLLVGIRGGVLSDPFASQFEKLAAKYHTAYVPDALQGLFGDRKLMYDSVHPNDKGYALLAARIAPVLKPLLK